MQYILVLAIGILFVRLTVASNWDDFKLEHFKEYVNNIEENYRFLNK